MSEEHKIPEGYSFWWEPIAQGGEEMPKGLERADQILFIQLRGLYGQVRGKIITRDMAVREKKMLMEEHRCYQFQDKMYDEFVVFLRKTELARAEFRKNPSIDSAWRLVYALEGRDQNKISM